MNFWERMDSLMSETVNRKSITMDLDIASNSFSVWAKRKTYPAVDVACKIAEKLNETVEYLVTGERKARYGLPPRVADIVEDLLRLDDTELRAVATLARGFAKETEDIPSMVAETSPGNMREYPGVMDSMYIPTIYYYR